MVEENSSGENHPQKIDIIFVTLPRLELRSPITAPAILKACVENEGFSSFCLDLNLLLWQQLDVSKYGHHWFDTDLTFRHQDKFLNFWNDVLKDCALKWIEKIRIINPAWVGLTIFSQRSKWISYQFCELLRQELPAVKIVCGGPFTEHVGSKLLSKNLIDAYVIGEGEEAIVQVLKGQLDSPGINGRPPEQMKDLNLVPIPNYDDFDFSQYPQKWSDPRVKDPQKMGTDFIYITGSRGCVRKCDFCDVQKVWPKYRYRSGENIALEMRQQNQRYGLKKFLFTDSLLNGSTKQLKDLCRSIINYKEKGEMDSVIWQGQFIARPEAQMADEYYSLMREAGCFFVSIGVESGSQTVRESMNKMFDDEALDFTFRACARNNIQMAWLMLVGHPSETEAEFQKTLNLLEKYQWINQLGIVRSVSLGPTLDIVTGSPLYKKQEELGIKWDKNNNWYLGENNRVTRINRWLRLKDKAQELGYPIVEKATEHLLMELEQYKSQEIEASGVVRASPTLGSVDRGE